MSVFTAGVPSRVMYNTGYETCAVTPIRMICTLVHLFVSLQILKMKHQAVFGQQYRQHEQQQAATQTISYEVAVNVSLQGKT